MAREDASMKELAILSAALFILFSEIAASNDCDCTIFPFQPDPPCFDICTGKILSTVSASDLENIVNILGLDREEVERIIEFNREADVQSLNDYRSVLSPRQFRRVKRTFQGLSQRQFEALIRALKR